MKLFTRFFGSDFVRNSYAMSSFNINLKYKFTVQHVVCTLAPMNLYVTHKFFIKKKRCLRIAEFLLNLPGFLLAVYMFQQCQGKHHRIQMSIDLDAIFFSICSFLCGYCHRLGSNYYPIAIY